jgi:hypothetical protein
LGSVPNSLCDENPVGVCRSKRSSQDGPAHGVSARVWMGRMAGGGGGVERLGGGAWAGWRAAWRGFRGEVSQSVGWWAGRLGGCVGRWRPEAGAWERLGCSGVRLARGPVGYKVTDEKVGWWCGSHSPSAAAGCVGACCVLAVSCARFWHSRFEAFRPRVLLRGRQMRRVLRRWVKRVGVVGIARLRGLGSCALRVESSLACAGRGFQIIAATRRRRGGPPQAPPEAPPQAGRTAGGREECRASEALPPAAPPGHRWLWPAAGFCAPSVSWKRARCDPTVIGRRSRMSTANTEASRLLAEGVEGSGFRRASCGL